MTQEDEKFIEENIYNFECVKIGFMKNLPLHILVGYEQIYRRYLDGGFILTSWCSSCVSSMMKRLIIFWDEYQAKKVLDAKVVQEPVQEPIPKKKGRPFKTKQ
jgi:hypothetical protein